MELDVERRERITAPLQLVWDEVDTLDRLLAKIPQAYDYDIVLGGQQATGKARLAWGPVKWTVDVEVLLADLRPFNHLQYVIAVPSLDMRYVATLVVAGAGSSETRLHYRAHLDVGHRMANRLRGMCNELIEDHTHSLVTRVKIRAEQRRLAQERLLR
jgi:carbon monoxide dehydrogenase subunit G